MTAIEVRIKGSLLPLVHSANHTPDVLMLVLRFIIGLIAADFRCKVQGEVKWPDETAKSKLRQGAKREEKRKERRRRKKLLTEWSFYKSKKRKRKILERERETVVGKG